MSPLACKIVMPALSRTEETTTGLFSSRRSRSPQRQRWPMHYTGLFGFLCSPRARRESQIRLPTNGEGENRELEGVMAAAEDVKCIFSHPKQTGFLRGWGGFKHWLTAVWCMHCQGKHVNAPLGCTASFVAHISAYLKCTTLRPAELSWVRHIRD